MIRGAKSKRARSEKPKTPGEPQGGHIASAKPKRAKAGTTTGSHRAKTQVSARTVRMSEKPVARKKTTAPAAKPATAKTKPAEARTKVTGRKTTSKKTTAAVTPSSRGRRPGRKTSAPPIVSALTEPAPTLDS